MKLHLSILGTAVLALGGCQSAITYHHSERNSIALEAKATDTQQPLQGIIGVRSRTILIAPGKSDGESASVISDFNLERSSEGLWGKTTLQSAFITGKAAVEAPPGTAVSITTGLGAGSVSSLTTSAGRELVGKIFDHLVTMTDDPVALQHVASLDSLASKVPDLKTGVYYDLSNVDLHQVDLTARNFGSGFIKVLGYDSLLVGSIAGIDEAIEADSNILFKGASVGAAEKKILVDEKARLAKERQTFFQRIGDDAAIDAAVDYATSFL